MYEGYYWISAEKHYGDSIPYYYVSIEEIHPAHFKTRNDIHHFDILKRISECHRDGIFTDMDGVRGFAKECIPFSYERVLEDLMRHGAFRCKVDIPPCLLDE
jgi:hypothetical protein|nr:MAG TPA: hypothetical protein [Caudoviricetes sp.]